MSGVVRSWACLNGRCGEQFTSWDSNPECPKCRCVRVTWIPGGGHVAGTARAADADLKTLADNYGLSDLMSAKRGDAAKVMASQPQSRSTRDNSVQFAPGFASVPYVMDGAGNARGVCVPSAQNVNFKTKLSAGVALGPGKLGMQSIGSATHVEARHRS